MNCKNYLFNISGKPGRDYYRNREGSFTKLKDIRGARCNLVLHKVLRLGVHLDDGGKVTEGDAEKGDPGQELHHVFRLVLVMHLDEKNICYEKIKL